MNGKPLSWHFKKSPQVCLSSCEAEYHAMSECTQEIKFARNLLKDLELPSNDVIPMQVDSKPVTAIAEIPRVTQGNKHFDICDHFIQNAIDDKVLKIDQTPSAENIADSIFIDSHPARLKARSSPRVKGIVVDGVISRDNSMVQKAIKEFWGNLLDSVRPYNKDSLQKLIENHKP